MPMSNEDQIAYWNGQTGQKWVRDADRLDALLRPFSDAVLETVSLVEGERVLDIGCGAGALTIAAASQAGAKHGAIGIDVSKPLLSLAEHRAISLSAPASFKEVDAADYQSDHPADALISRFGVMFFADPVAAFANLRGNVRPGGRMTFACWQSLAENDWARAPLDAALPLLSVPPQPSPPGSPGPFAFADQDLIGSILRNSSWNDIDIQAWNGPVTLPGDTLQEVAGFMVELGPVARLVKEAGIDLSRVEDALIDNLSNHRDSRNGRVTMPAAAWIVSAKAP